MGQDRIGGNKMISIDNLVDASKTLKTCYQDYAANQDSPFIEYIADSCVKRFEYTLETAWKLAKRIFIQKYAKTEQELTMNNIFRYMQSYGWTQNWENWKNYYTKRNNVAHEYNLAKSRVLLEIIPDFIKDVDYFINKLSEDENAN